MKALIIILAIAVILVSIWQVREWQYRKFWRFVKIGDPVKFYIGEEKFYGKYQGVNNENYSIIEHDNSLALIHNDNIHPVTGYKYE